jgi:hypothetical protein
MKKIIVVLGILIASNAIAQTDSAVTKKADTIKIGNMVIVNDKVDKSDKTNHVVNITIDSKKKNKYKNDDVHINIGNDTLVSVVDDTVKVGRIRIINKEEGTYGYGQKDVASLLQGDFKKTKITIEKAPKKLQNISTNWWIFDLGFANLVDHTAPLLYNPLYMYLPYPGSVLPTPIPNSTDLNLNNEKSSNVNIWIVQQKLNLHKHYWNLKYGIGIEMYNFRFKQPISFSNTPGNYVYFDNAHFSKNKLFVEYLTVPIQLNYKANPDNNKSFYASIGLSGSYLIQSHTKQISEERGKRKVNGNFNLNDFKMATIGELGIGSIRLYGSYNMTNMFDKKLTNFDMAPFAVGVRFSKF